MTRYAVLGPGGVGGLVAAALTRAGLDVLVVAREPTAALIAERGIDVRSVVLGDFVARPAAAGRLEETVDVLFVTPKATQLGAALERVSARPQVVIPLLNGLDHVALLRERLGDGRVAAATIRVESDRPEARRVVQTSPSVRIELAADDPGVAAGLPAVAAALSAAGLPARVQEGERQVMWSKLVRLNSLASTTAAADAPIGFVRSDPAWRATLVACVEETAAVARADGAAVEASATLAELDGAHASLGSSMQRDLAAGRKPELDAIQGSVLRAAARHGLGCPTVARLAGEIARRAGIEAPQAGIEAPRA